MRKIIRIVGVLAALVACYYCVVGGLYLSGFRWYQFPAASMEPTILKGAHAVGRLSKGYRDHVERFQIALFTTDRNPGVIYAKRVIGLPNERVSVGDGSIVINGAKVDLPAAVRTDGLLVTGDVTVPEDAVFVLGDNTSVSLDSRQMGPVPLKHIIGHILFKK